MDEDFQDWFPSILTVHPRLSEGFRISPEVESVQFKEALNKTDYAVLANALRSRPEIRLRVYGEGLTHLDFLKHFSDLRKLQIDLWFLTDLTGLQAVRELDEFIFGRTKTRSHSLEVLGRFPTLRSLYIEGHHKGIGAISQLKHLEELTLRSITLPELDLLAQLPRLRRLGIKLGGTTNLEALAKLRALEYLELWLIRGLADLSVIAEMISLESLFLQALKNVTMLPSFASLRLLRRVHLETMKGLTDLSAVAEAPALEKLVLLDMTSLDPASLRCFAGHPTLREFCGGLGSVRRNAYAEVLLGLPSNGYSPPGARKRAALEVMANRARDSLN